MLKQIFLLAGLLMFETISPILLVLPVYVLLKSLLGLLILIHVMNSLSVIAVNYLGQLLVLLALALLACSHFSACIVTVLIAIFEPINMTVMINLDLKHNPVGGYGLIQFFHP